MRKALRGVGLWMAVLGLGLAGCGLTLEEQQAQELAVTEAQLERARKDRGKPCLSTQDCPSFLVCSTERGVCNPPPGCDPSEEICPAVCAGTCELPDGPPPVERCGENLCTPGTFCCNPLRSLCVPEGNFCIFTEGGE